MMIRLIFTVCILLSFFSLANAQKVGDFEIGGSFMFRGETISGETGGKNRFFINPRFGYYVSRSTEIELDATIDINFTDERTFTENEMTVNILHHIAAMEGGEARVFLLIGGGLWSSYESVPELAGRTVGNGSLVLGAGSKSFLSKLAIVRADVQLHHLFPSGSKYTKRRNVFMVTVGVGLLL